MLDIKWIRSNPDALKTALVRRGDVDFSSPEITSLLSSVEIAPTRSKAAIEFLLQNLSRFKIEKIAPLEALDADRRNLIYKVEQLKANRNKVSMEIAKRKAAKEAADDLMMGMKAASDEIKGLDDRVAELDRRFEEVLLTIPNAPHSSIPNGCGDVDNQEIRKFSEPHDFAFTPKDHVDIGTTLGILDLDRATKIAGARFAVLMRDGAKLERALTAFMLDLHIKKHGYTEVWPPLMVNSTAMRGTGQLPKFEMDLFKIRDFDFYLIPTAEVPVTNLYANEILSEASLPIKLTAYTPCFRSEAGSYGKDTRGLIRQHQFNKVELVKFAHPERSYEELEALLADAEEVLKILGIPYRVVVLSSGDLGFSAAKTYDIEVWLPSQKTYREISSCSNFEDFQARRANIRFKGEGKGAKPSFVHTLNGSGLAVGRTWVSVLENFQDEGGRVMIPEALRPYMDGKTHIEPFKG